jgi:hypothetical protein
MRGTRCSTSTSRVDGDFERLRPGIAAIEDQGFALQRAIGGERNLAPRQHLAAVLDAQAGPGAAHSVAAQRNGGAQPGLRQRAGGQHHGLNFDVLIGMVVAEAHGVDGDALAADGGDGVPADAAGVIGSIAQHHHRAQRQGRRFGHRLFQGVAKAGGGLGARKLAGILNAIGRGAELVEAHLEAAAQRLQQAIVQDLLRGGLARAGAIGDRHAARIVHQHGDHVLLRPERGHAQGGMPEQEQNQGRHRRFEQPDGQGPRPAEHATIAPDVPEQPSRRCQDGDGQHPRGPGGQKDEAAFVKKASRVFEQELEHEVHVRAVGRYRCRRAAGGRELRNSGAFHEALVWCQHIMSCVAGSGAGRLLPGHFGRRTPHACPCRSTRRYATIVNGPKRA